MKRARSLVLLAGIATTCSTSCREAPEPKVPPVTTALAPAAIPAGPEERAAKAGAPSTKKTNVVDAIHGTMVADPYRWLEEGDSADVKAWTAAQNAHTRKVLDAIAGREALKAQVTELLQVGFVTAPVIRATKTDRRYFHTKREGAQNQPTLYVRDGAQGKDRVLLDASTLSEDGTTALDWWYPSWDGAFVAWGKSESGSEESTLYVRDVATGKDLPDTITRTRHASLAWLPDGKRFYYSRYPEAGTVPAGDEKYFSKIYLHVVGQDPATDKLAFGEGRDKTDIPIVSISPNGRWLVVRVHMGWDKSEVFFKDLSKPNADSAAWTPLAVKIPALFDPTPLNDRLYVQTNDGAPKFKLYAVDYAKPERTAWKEILPEHGTDVLREVAISKSEIVGSYMHDASSRVERFGLDGKSRGQVALPFISTVGLTSMPDGQETFVSLSSYAAPSRVYRLDPSRGALSEPWDRVGAKFSADVEVQTLFAKSKDGTRVPMFVVAKKGLKRDGQNPTVLYGYGGFNVNQTPTFSPRALSVVQSGAVWVTAILRGGGELGEDWHKAGMLERKQNVFDDFIACAETLVKEKITSPEHLGIMGGSNGGLLVATAVTQRPDLFRAGLSLVPLTDMIRYHRFRIAKLWIPEYGSADDAKQFSFLYAYSPYHRVKDGERYPSLLFTTAESDSRVDPMHARKMAARLQDAQGDPQRPVLIRVETKAGHGAGKPVSKLAEELTDELSFLLREIGPSAP